MALTKRKEIRVGASKTSPPDWAAVGVGIEDSPKSCSLHVSQGQQCPEMAPRDLWKLSRGQSWGKKSLPFLPTHRSHLIFYNPFSLQGRGKEGQEVREAGKEAKDEK